MYYSIDINLFSELEGDEDELLLDYSNFEMPHSPENINVADPLIKDTDKIVHAVLKPCNLLIGKPFNQANISFDI